MTTKEVVKKEETQMAETAPDWLKQGQNRGQENVTAGDMTVPRLEVLQDLSPRVKKRDPAYIEGAEPGMLVNSVSGQLYGNEVTFVPVYFVLEWVIWKKQAAGGGFIGAFPTKSEAQQAWDSAGLGAETFKNAAGQLEEAYEILDTAQQYGLLLAPHAQPERIVISMYKTKMKASRQLNTLISMGGNYDRFAKCYRCSTKQDKNKVGQEYWNIAFTALGFVQKNVYDMAELMYEALRAGAISADRTFEETVVSSESEF